MFQFVGKILSRRVPLVALALWCTLFAGCSRAARQERATIELTQVPLADAGGPQKVDFISGKVHGNTAGQQVVIYAHSGVWWVQPLGNQPFTRIQADATWRNTTHLGTEYAALLVDPGYDPPAKLQTPPAVGGKVAAVATSPGRPGESLTAKTIHFSGYDWSVRSAGSDRGGAPRLYDASNAWVDSNGYLHLRMEQRNGDWHCAEINLDRSLGYGTYQFVVEDLSHLSPSAVVSMFTYDENSVGESRDELDVELSHWGDPSRENSQFVVQPFYVPQNIFRFNSPAATLTYTFRWEPGSAKFTARRGAQIISEHAFDAGIPGATGQTAHLDLYDFHYSKKPIHEPAEVVIEKFAYLP
jgi:hypothetical protein